LQQERHIAPQSAAILIKRSTATLVHNGLAHERRRLAAATAQPAAGGIRLIRGRRFFLMGANLPRLHCWASANRAARVTGSAVNRQARSLHESENR
jgi:hypothetical protein